MFKVSEEEAKVAEIKERVTERQKRCDEDLAKAEPAVRQAEAALDTLNKVLYAIWNSWLNFQEQLSQILLEHSMILLTLLKFVYLEQSDRAEIFRYTAGCSGDGSSSCSRSILTKGQSTQRQKLESL